MLTRFPSAAFPRLLRPAGARVKAARAIAWAAVAVAGLLAASCDRVSPTPGTSGGTATAGSPAGADAWFQDVTREVGVDFRHTLGADSSYFMPDCMGSGVALLDYDGDGRLDLYLIQNGGPESGALNRLYHQEPDGRFRDASAGSGLAVAGRGMGVAVGDVDNDGGLDVLLTEYGRLRLFRNEGGGKFRDVSEPAGVASRLWATSASFFDYDRDGWLDLIVADYVNYDPSRWCADAAGRREFCGPDAFAGTVAKLFHNRGAAGVKSPAGVQLEDVTARSGLAARPGPGLGAVCIDFDGDHWQDILIANDGAPNHLWINRHDGTFAEEGAARGIALNSMGRTAANMGIAVGDADGDGLFDVFVTHLTDETPTLWRSVQPGLFDDATASAGLNRARWRGTGFGTVMADFDCDGALDIVAVNGKVKRGQTAADDARVDPTLGAFWRIYAERDQLFRNTGAGQFEDISDRNDALCGVSRVSRGVAYGDLDNDGRLDLVVTTVAGEARVFRNVAARRGHWLLLRLIEPTLHRDAYGAEVTVIAEKRRLRRWVNPGSSYLSSSDPRVHVGLGPADHFDGILVVWPDGAQERFPGGPADRELVLRRGEGGEAGR